MAEAISAAEACTHFLKSLDPDKARAERPAVEHFVAWYGADQSMAALTGEAVSRFAASLTPAERTEHHEPGEDELAEVPPLEPLRGFFAYCSRLAFTTDNFVPYLHLPAGGGGARAPQQAAAELGGRAFYITIEGLQGLERELTELKGRRLQIADDLRAAMADKDFRENAPLDAARDAQAHLEARIRDVEDQLRRAVIIDEQQKRGRANVGSRVRLLNLTSNREQTFHLVSPGEVDPANGKISSESPVGRAVLNHMDGDEVTVQTPGGVMQFRVVEVIG